MSDPRCFGRSLNIFLLTIWITLGVSASEYDCTGEVSGVCRVPATCMDEFFTRCPIPGSSCCPDPILGSTEGQDPTFSTTGIPDTTSNLTVTKFFHGDLNDVLEDMMDRASRCHITTECVSRGGFCATNKMDCQGKMYKRECKGRKCFCCVPTVSIGTCRINGLPGVVCSKPRSCTGYGTGLSGVYEICPITNCPPIQVQCKNDGWTVILHRNTMLKSPCNFARDWIDYKKGFCNASYDYWIGNEMLHELTKYPYAKMQITGITASGESRTLKYGHFSVNDEANNYGLYVNYYDGTSTGPDLFRYPSNSYLTLYGMDFTTYDRDNDKRINVNCADFADKGGWWYNSCTGILVTKKKPLQWYYWSSTEYGPVEVQEVYMSIKPN